MRAEDVAHKIFVELEMRGLHKEPVGVDVVELPVLFALQKEGLTIVDGQQLMQDVRVIKTQDEITLLNMACMMVDVAYEELYRFMKPGVRESECVDGARAAQFLQTLATLVENPLRLLD